MRREGEQNLSTKVERALTTARKQSTTRQGKKPGENSNPQKKTRRPPRTATVTITCPPDQYAAAMRKAREAINLEKLGIKSLRPKRAITGALVLEIPDPDGVKKATTLREKMEIALSDMEGVRVARPVKLADLRIRDMDNSIEEIDFKEAVAKAGGCDPTEIKVGTRRPAPNGLNSAWIQCPLFAANKVAASGRIQIGWMSSRVEMLASRQTQCYRCLEIGHVQGQCTNEKDRRDACYRCGQAGHQARNCTNAVHCILCQEASKPANHCMGEPSCAETNKKGRVQKGGTASKRNTADAALGGGKTGNQPAVRGEGSSLGGPPVPVWLEGKKEDRVERMEVELMPSSQPPLSQRQMRRESDKEGSMTSEARSRLQ